MFVAVTLGLPRLVKRGYYKVFSELVVPAMLGLCRTHCTAHKSMIVMVPSEP
jgi:hypothetical protein